jgi:hypothetical protein
MLDPRVVAAIKLPGISNLPRGARLHFAKAYVAEQDGEYLTAEFELNRAVAEEAAAEDAHSDQKPAA